ncbi:MAG TPA: M4 family metallopeptidase [Solirubrobacterales bacterium]
MAGLERFHFHVAEQPQADVEALPQFQGLRGPTVDGVEVGFASDESAARHFIGQILIDDDRPAMRGISAPRRPEVVPDLQLESVKELPGTESRLVRFDQTKESIPVFGGHAVCELTADRGLVSASGEVAEVTDVSPIATLAQADALKSLAEHLGVSAESIEGGQPPELQFFADEDSKWHLTWLFSKIPAAPRDFESHGHGLGRSPRDNNPRFDYLVDAHDGSLVYYYSATPIVTAPTFGSGVNEDETAVEFLGQMDGANFQMHDPLRNIVTYDLKHGDVEHPVLQGPIEDNDGNLGDTMKGAVSAHANSSIVDDFYRGVLRRDGIDDNGMELVNVVNCCYPLEEEPPIWHNAAWYDGRMWYGQAPDAGGVLRSFSRYLDVTGHELTHGVTEKTAGLVYRDQTGALNESYSDILGMIIKNWDFKSPADGGDVSTWDWELGAGLGPNGAPLRDLSDPTKTGDPDHMSKYVTTTHDSGGVHTNSNIHNKAAYNVLTSTEADGSRTFTPLEAAYLFYIGLTRLGKLSKFSDSLTAVKDVAGSLWRGDPATRAAKEAAIVAAYAKVGIS